jgi:hypothetical protein
MIAEVDIFGVYLHSALVAAIIAGFAHVVLRNLLTRVNFYSWVWHKNLVDLAVFVLLWGGATWLLYVVGNAQHLAS